jgi:hypothetical protein
MVNYNAPQSLGVEDQATWIDHQRQLPRLQLAMATFQASASGKFAG